MVLGLEGAQCLHARGLVGSERSVAEVADWEPSLGSGTAVVHREVCGHYPVVRGCSYVLEERNSSSHCDFVSFNSPPILRTPEGSHPFIDCL
jgi:hypothetical protein